MCVVLARGAHLSRHQPPVETLRVYPKNVHQPWPLALKSVPVCSTYVTAVSTYVTDITYVTDVNLSRDLQLGRFW